ncbi:hypothetical protein ACFCZV_13245 [Streptomyces hydrogenans]|uniref:hypothetical protein n=1 Tax=Streptomyces hydrogenans TaxID=1873719 RepID=UPI0035E23C4E
MIRRLAAGSALVARHRSEALAAWVAAGRREDLSGWAAALGPAVRLVALAAVGYGALALVRAMPWLMWLLTAWWMRAAWRATAPAEDADEELEEGSVDEEEPLVGAPAEAAVALLREVLAGRPAVHLSTVLAHLQEHGQCGGWKVADLRARLEALGVPVAPKVKVNGVPTRGVYAADLDRLFPTEETPPSPARVDAA